MQKLKKFRSETPDNMDSWTSRGGKSQRGEEKKKADHRGESVRRKKVQVREKVGRKVAIHCVLPMICGSGGSTSRLAKGAGKSHVVRGDMKNCMPLWREAHLLQVKKLKSPHVRTTFGSSDVEKVHPVVARSTFPSLIYKAHHSPTTFGS